MQRQPEHALLQRLGGHINQGGDVALRNQLVLQGIGQQANTFAAEAAALRLPRGFASNFRVSAWLSESMSTY